MKRRNFLQISASAGSAVAGLSCSTEIIKKPSVPKEKITISRMSPENLRDRFRADLLDEYLPFFDKFMIDHELGGFMCNVDRDGTLITSNKRGWYQGRGIWLYSYIYNNIDQNTEILETAKKSVEFILKTKPEGNKLWTRTFSKDGKPLDQEDWEIYTDCYIAEGLAEYSKASGDERYWREAKAILLKVMNIYDNRPDFGKNVVYWDAGLINQQKRDEGVPGARILGFWMVIIWLITQMLKIKKDDQLESIAARCVDSIMIYHYNPEFNLFNEYLYHDLSRIDGSQNQESTSHAIETLWMLMYEAVRIKSKKLFNLAAERFKRTVGVQWDYVYGGAFQGLMNVDNNVFDLQKALWVQSEILIGTMYLIENTADQWAFEWFSKVDDYVEKKHRLKQYGYPLWILFADRKVTFEKHFNRVDNYHHPRHLVLSIMSLERIIKNGVKIIDRFS